MIQITEHEKALKDFAECEAIGMCDAHNSDGSWRHRDGPNPCKVIL